MPDGGLKSRLASIVVGMLLVDELYFSLASAMMVEHHSPIRILRHGDKKALQLQPRHA